MSLQIGPNSLASSGSIRVYASLALAAAANLSRVTRAIRCETDGTLVVTGADGTDAAMPFKAGETQMVQAVAIKSSGSSGCVPITVLF